MTGKALFTIVLEYDGGTYVSQVRARNPNDALRTLARRLQKHGPKKTLPQKLWKHIGKEFEQEHVIPLGRTKNAWCGSALVRDKLALLTMIKTAEK